MCDITHSYGSCVRDINWATRDVCHVTDLFVHDSDPALTSSDYPMIIVDTHPIADNLLRWKLWLLARQLQIHTHAHTRTLTHTLISNPILYYPICIVWLYYASSSTMWWFPDQFFLLSVSACIVCPITRNHHGSDLHVWYTHSLTPSHTHSHTLTHTHSLTHTLIHTLTHTHTHK